MGEQSCADATISKDNQADHEYYLSFKPQAAASTTDSIMNAQIAWSRRKQEARSTTDLNVPTTDSSDESSAMVDPMMSEDGNWASLYIENPLTIKRENAEHFEQCEQQFLLYVRDFRANNKWVLWRDMLKDL
jgi:hypothetical protein